MFVIRHVHLLVDIQFRFATVHSSVTQPEAASIGSVLPRGARFCTYSDAPTAWSETDAHGCSRGCMHHSDAAWRVNGVSRWLMNESDDWRPITRLVDESRDWSTNHKIGRQSRDSSKNHEIGRQ